MTTLYAGRSITIHASSTMTNSGGTSGCVVAARLAENPEIRVLLLEAVQYNKDLENVHMTGG